MGRVTKTPPQEFHRHSTPNVKLTGSIWSPHRTPFSSALSRFGETKAIVPNGYRDGRSREKVEQKRPPVNRAAMLETIAATRLESVDRAKLRVERIDERLRREFLAGHALRQFGCPIAATMDMDVFP